MEYVSVTARKLNTTEKQYSFLNLNLQCWSIDHRRRVFEAGLTTWILRIAVIRDVELSVVIVV
jgi:hypothetical protein